ncbi:hypothetical protein C8R47DRAFT_209079 [Mycena vitilis]|nr:hypothetical protein C8R47DRAFT_209079 [Mycena vitilis]
MSFVNFVGNFAILQLEDLEFLVYVARTHSGGYRQFDVALVGDNPATPLRGPSIRVSTLFDTPTSTAFFQLRVPVQMSLDEPLPQAPADTCKESRYRKGLAERTIFWIKPLSRWRRIAKFFGFKYPILDYCYVWDEFPAVKFVKFIESASFSSPMPYADPATFITVTERLNKARRSELERRIQEANASDRQFYSSSMPAPAHHI